MIKFTKLNYIKSNDGISEININEIPAQQLQFAISDQLFFDTLLMEIRGKTIAYHENDLLEEIDRLEKAKEINFELLDKKRNDLQEIRNKKMEGVKIRSRVRWISDGEKVTKYFCNFEKRNFVSKCMNSLKKNNGETIKDQPEILNETMQLLQDTIFEKR